MDLGAVLRGVLPTHSRMSMNMTGDNMTKQNSDRMMESLLPLMGRQFSPLLGIFMFVYDLLGTRLGIEPTMVLTLFGFIWAGNRFLRQIYMAAYVFVQDNFTCNIHISSSDEMYMHVMKWLAIQPRMTNSRSLTAETVSKTAWEEEEEAVLDVPTISPDGTGIYLNFSNHEAKAPPRFIPAMGTHNFWHGGHYFRLHRKQESFFDDGGTHGFQTFKDKEDLIISCFGRSPGPIKKLLQHCKEHYYTDHHARTIVKRPSPQNVRRYGGRHSWTQVANRPVRPMKTVVLDHQQKVQVLTDMNEYLHPATPRWYANRGIPLRRGYLFHGPPGTGKTSLSFALAGVFGLDIYVISLLEPSLTEEDLSGLFNSLPRRCVVLLEDIDTAGLSRAPEEQAADVSQASTDAEKHVAATKQGERKRGKKDGGNGAAQGSTTAAAAADAATNATTTTTTTTTAAGGPNDWKVSDLARALKKEGGEGDQKKGISLSGLLNAIDGVASHEGRVLIMTTNKPEVLDDALIRPGRVDLQVGFTNATRRQARELFERMYEAAGSAAFGQAVVLRPAVPEELKMAAGENGKAAAGGGVQNGKAANGSANGHAAVGIGRREEEEEEEAEKEEEDDVAVDGHDEEAANGSAAEGYYPGSPGGDKKKTGGLFDGSETPLLTASELGRLAATFAGRIPDGNFSPAEIQGFLLRRKKNPRQAVAEVEAWAEALLRQKANKTKVLVVQ